MLKLSCMKKWIYRIVFVVSLCVFGYSAYNLWDIYSQKQQVATQTKQLEKKVIKKKRENKVVKNVLEPDWAALQAENQDIVGWIYVPCCDISFPVMQSKDNEYYLNHTVSGEYNNRGSIFWMRMRMHNFKMIIPLYMAILLKVEACLPC